MDTRADIESFTTAFGRPEPPSDIWQDPLDGDPGHYGRLCALEPGALPEAIDFTDYASDIAYQPNIQENLFACLLPACLNVWQHDLMHNHHSDFAGSVETFQLALARRPLLQDCLKAEQVDAVMVFMRDSVLDRIDREDSLSHAGQYAAAYGWFFRLGSFAVLFPELESLWRGWWRFDTPGQAIAALQYISCLMYEDPANPIFAAWTREHGGGTPGLWETDAQTFNECWRMENVLFFIDTVTPDYVHDGLTRAEQVLTGVIDSDVPARMLDDFEPQRPLLADRLQALPELVSQPMNATSKWPPRA